MELKGYRYSSNLQKIGFILACFCIIIHSFVLTDIGEQCYDLVSALNEPIQVLVHTNSHSIQISFAIIGFSTFQHHSLA